MKGGEEGEVIHGDTLTFLVNRVKVQESCLEESLSSIFT